MKLRTVNIFRQAAKQYWQRKKEYVKRIVDRIAVLEKENQVLIEELKSFPNL